MLYSLSILVSDSDENFLDGNGDLQVLGGGGDKGLLTVE